MPQPARAAKPAGRGGARSIAIQIEIVVPNHPLQTPLFEAILEPTPGFHIDDHTTFVLHAMKQIVLAFDTARIDICFIHYLFPRAETGSNAVPVTGGRSGSHGRTVNPTKSFVKNFISFKIK